MYQVLKLYGDSEPWWFLEGWEADVIDVKEFDDYQEALSYYKQSKTSLAEEYPQCKSQGGNLTAFWDPKERYWCEECVEHLQRYHSLMLLESDTPFAERAQKKPAKRTRPCQLK